MLLISSIRLAERTTENRGYLAHFIRLKYTVGHESEMRKYIFNLVQIHCRKLCL
jgi:hypothetical protein